VIYPQRKKEKLHQQMLSRLKKGDQVITIGGIYGTVVDVKDDVVILKVNHDVKLKFAKTTIHTLMEKKQEKRRTR
jgi:preprotein translocase subunit YajC